MTRLPRAALLSTALATCLLLVPAASSAAPNGTTAPNGKTAPDRTATTARTAAATTPYDWPTFSHDNQRTGTVWNVTNVHGTPKQVWNVPLDGGAYASPIVADGAVIVATQNNSVYRVSGNKVVWRRSLGAAVPGSALPCGDINPAGVISTPAYDAATGTVVVVALVNNPIRHVAFGLNPLTGALRWSQPVDVPSNVPGIDPKAMQQRGALLVSGRRVYVAYGGLAGDCSVHRGAVVGVDLDKPASPLWTWVVHASRIGGVWAPGGPVERPVSGGLYITVANGPTFQTGAYDYTNAVLRIAAEHIVDFYSPTTWRSDNQNDIGLGSQSPTLVGKFVFIAGKTGTAYVLNRDALGHIGGQLSQATVCKSFGGTAVTGSVVYIPCTDGIRAVRIDASGHMIMGWHAAANITGTPVIGGGRIWSLDADGGVLHALNPSTGKDIETMQVGATEHWVSPVLSRNAVFVATKTGLVAYNWS